MGITVIETIQNAKYNLENAIRLGCHDVNQQDALTEIAIEQLDEAIAALEANYDLYDDIDAARKGKQDGK